MSPRSSSHTGRLRLRPRARPNRGNVRIVLWAVGVVAAAALGIRIAAGPPPGAAIASAGRVEVPAEVERILTSAAAMTLTPEQERTRTEALSRIPAPCCKEHRLAARCCGCTMSKAISAYATSLVKTESDVGRVQAAILSWVRSFNPSGYTGTECRAKRCERSLVDGGCGGMALPRARSNGTALGRMQP